jgi:hypothetical protein
LTFDFQFLTFNLKLKKEEFQMHGYRALRKGMRIVGLSVLGLITIGVTGLIFGLLVQLLWNWLMPDIFHLPEIGYWQAFGIVILGKLILGSFSPGHHKHPYPHPFPGHFARHHQHYFHRHNGFDDAAWQIKGGWHNWDYYEDWWRKEGKAAFENYIDRVTPPPAGSKPE